MRVSIKRAEAAASRRLRVISGVAVSLGLLTLVALWNTHEAVKARAGADTLVNYMLTDLWEQLKASGNVRLLQGSLEEVRRHYHAFKPDPARSAQLSIAEGSILKSLGRSGEASVAFEKAIQITEKSTRETDMRALQAQALNRLSDLLAATDLRRGQEAAERSVENFATIGPNGSARANINGCAAAIELYLDLTWGVEQVPCVRWLDYKQQVERYQGSLDKELKARYQNAFLGLEKVEKEYDFSGLRAILDKIVKECVSIAGRRAGRPLWGDCFA